MTWRKVSRRPTSSTSRPSVSPAQHAHLETHAALGRLDDAGRLVVRTSTQAPFLVRRILCALFGLPEDRVRVVAGRVGGGFGGKQEMLVEDVVALAVLRTGRPVKLEYTRAEQFTGATTRHSCTVTVRAGARRDGTLTALRVRAVYDTGAYGNHGAAVLACGCTEPLALYRCANKKVDGYAVYTHTVPAGAFRGYGRGQVGFAVECAVDELARRLAVDPVAFRRRNVIRAGDPLVTGGAAPGDDVDITGFGLDECLAAIRTRTAAAAGEAAGQAGSASGEKGSAPGEEDSVHGRVDPASGGVAAEPGGPDPPSVPAPPGWLTGEGCAVSMLITSPIGGHVGTVEISLEPDGTYRLTAGVPEIGSGTTTTLVQLAADALATTPGRITVHQADTGSLGHDSGMFGSAGTVVTARAALRAARCLAAAICDYAAELTSTAGLTGSGCRLREDSVVCGPAPSLSLAYLARTAARTSGRTLKATGRCEGTARSAGFQAHWTRVAVNPATGEIRVLDSVQAIDAGHVLNPAQARGQAEGAIAQALGAALWEEVALDERGEVTTTSLRHYRLAAFAEVPVGRVRFVRTSDPVGPMGAKSLSEGCYLPVAPALANAVRDATGVRFTDLPLRADRVWDTLHHSRHDRG
ncbi:molybdopterin cofactor-binding domain-containing protein [Streptomyces sp. MST-110588]|uniref:xanthine dehydrogenase family protein molybdopterin-binding subunit n=1 Tax=Streptomyces sp. MST-110588 TaxID=2833628 RepID=UPI003242721A